jgi:uncharacterized membrane protein YfcA
MDWILCLIAGALAGSLVSMTGSGAGFLLTPGLSLALSFGTFPNADLFKIVVATTHGASLITNLAAFQAHAVRRSIDWAAFIRLWPGSITGAAAGALLAMHVDAVVLELVFIAFAVALSARLLRRHRKIEPKLRPPLGVWITRSAAMGVLAALTGAGGVLPLFLKEYLPARKVVGTTVAGCLIMSMPAATTYYMLSASPARCGSDCLGPIFLPGMQLRPARSRTGTLLTRECHAPCGAGSRRQPGTAEDQSTDRKPSWRLNRPTVRPVSLQ